jgi:ABC-type amino acid transport substrate-binding protein
MQKTYKTSERHCRKPKSLWIPALFVLFIFLSPPSNLEAREIVRVGVSHFPPFYIIENESTVSGLGVDLTKIFNEMQDTYEFVNVLTTPRRRHKMFDEGRFDVSFFDHLEWGWDKSKVDASDVYFNGGEVFITANKPDRKQSYFETLKNKSIAAINGYHYKFSGYISDPKKLKKRFNITLTNDQDQIIKMVVSGNIDLGIITETYLLSYFQTHPSARTAIIAASSYDQEYNFRTIVRKTAKISAEKIYELIKKVQTDPKYDWLKQKYGIQW